MSLASYELPTKKIDLTDGVYFTVRGLSLPDISKIVEAHEPIVTELFSKYAGSVNDESLENISMLGNTLMESAPILVSHIIAIAADEPGEADKIAQLPFPTQMEALEAIGSLTFIGSGGVKKTVAMVAKIVRGMTDLAVASRSSVASSMA